MTASGIVPYLVAHTGHPHEGSTVASEWIIAGFVALGLIIVVTLYALRRRA